MAAMSPPAIISSFLGTQLTELLDKIERGETSEVRGKQPNELNIYDMTGNVREWCADWYSPLGTAAVTDPEGLSSAGYGRVYRGGSCNDSAQYCRVAHREGLSSSSKSYNIGFRVVITMD